MNHLATSLAVLSVLMIFTSSDARQSVGRISFQAREFAAQQEGRMIKGTWGGNHISLEVTEDGAHVEFDCAHGTVSEPLRVDNQGKFRALGSFAKESGGPQRVDDEDKGVAVIYSGTTDGKTATFTITNSMTEEVIGTFSVTLGKRSRITKCL